MITSLITGGAGFIGSHVAQNCIELGHKVIVLDDLSGGYRDQVPATAVFVHGSISDVTLLGQLFEQYKFDYVYHLAAYAAEGLSHFIRRFNYQNNLIGSVNLINLSVIHKIKCFVFTSSIAVYGSAQMPVSEETIPEPEDPYGIAKYSIEMDLKTARHMFGLNYIIFRPHNVYGENQNFGDKYRNVIGIFINQLMQRKSLTIFGDGNQIRAFSYIDNVAPYIANCINIYYAYNEIFNIGSNKHYSLNELANIVSRQFGSQPDIKYLTARKEVVNAYCDHAKATYIFEIRNSTNLEDGVLKMIEWARRIGTRESKDFNEIEINQGLPDGWKTS